VGPGLGSLSRLSDARSRSISPENRDGSVGRGGRATEGTGAECARELGEKWKVSPSIEILPGETLELADIKDQGVIQQIWMAPLGNVKLRNLILTFTWDDQEHPTCVCKSGPWLQLLLGNAVSQPGSNFPEESR